MENLENQLRQEIIAINFGYKDLQKSQERLCQEWLIKLTNSALPYTRKLAVLSAYKTYFNK